MEPAAAIEPAPCPWLQAVVALRLRQHRAAARLASGRERVRAEARAYAAEMGRLVPWLLSSLEAAQDEGGRGSSLALFGETGGRLAAELDLHVGQLDCLPGPGRDVDAECALHEREMLGLLGCLLCRSAALARA